MTIVESPVAEGIEEEDEDALPLTKEEKHSLQAWQIEAAAVDRSVRILPGVKKMIASIPEGHYAVATSGAKTYGELPFYLYTPFSMLTQSS